MVILSNFLGKNIYNNNLLYNTSLVFVPDSGARVALEVMQMNRTRFLTLAVCICVVRSNRTKSESFSF